MSNKRLINVIVTAANRGPGVWTTRHLLDLDDSVIMACRSIKKTQQAMHAFKAFDQRKPLEIKQVDRADIDSCDQQKAMDLWQAIEALIDATFLPI